MSEEVKKEETKNEVIVRYNDLGVAEFSDQKELGSIARLYMATAQVPKSLRDEGIEAVIAAVSLCRQLKIPDSCMGRMYYVNGVITCYGDLVTALAERHEEYGERRDFFITEEGEEICFKNKNLKTGKPWAAVVQVKKKGHTVWNEHTFSVDDAITAGLLTKDQVSTKRNWEDATWTKYMKDMMWNKANARAMKANYASALKGVNYYEDIVESFDKIRDVTAPDGNDRVKDLNARFTKKETEQATVQ